MTNRAKKLDVRRALRDLANEDYDRIVYQVENVHESVLSATDRHSGRRPDLEEVLRELQDAEEQLDYAISDLKNVQDAVERLVATLEREVEK